MVLSPVHPSSPLLENVLAHLTGVRSSLRGWVACCPAHVDREPSLSIRQGEQGQVLLKCFASCSLERIVEAMGLTLVDLFPDGASARASSNGAHHSTLTLLDLALEKQLPWRFLLSLGIIELPSGGLHIPYHLLDGTPAPRSRLRTALIARQGSRWSKGTGRIVPYGLERLDEARKAGYLVLVEGESDCWTLWYQGFPALGLPGAEMAGTLEPSMLSGNDRLYLVQEPDTAGATLVKTLTDRLKGWRWQGKAAVIHLPTAKDPNDLYKQDRKGFRAAFQQALDAAQPILLMQPESGACPDQTRPRVFSLQDLLSWDLPPTRWAIPGLLPLSFIHKLQTEMKSQMNALQQGLDAKPALPQGFPTGRTIAPAGQIAAHLGNGLPEGSCGHARRHLTGLSGNNGEQVGIEHLASGTLRVSTCKVSQVQQTDCQRRQQAQQADQAGGGLHLALFETASSFETLVIVFHDPAVFIPPHPLPGLLEGRGGDRGQQNPFQGLFPSRRLLFPHPNGPYQKRFFAEPLLEARRQHGQGAKGELHYRRTSRSSMAGRHLQRSAGLRRPSAHLIEQIPLPSLFWLDASILKRSHQKMGLRGSAGLKERKHIGAAISDMHNGGLGGKASQARHLAHPNIGLSFSSLSALASRFCYWGWGAYKRLLHRASQHLAAVRQDGQHRLQIQPSSSLIADLTQALGFGMMAQVHFGGVLHQQHDGFGLNLFADLLPMRLHQCLKGHILFIQQSVQGYRLFPGLHLGGQRRRGILRHARGRFHGSCCSTDILELACSKGSFGPAFRVQDFLCVHLPILAAC